MWLDIPPWYLYPLVGCWYKYTLTTPMLTNFMPAQLSTIILNTFSAVTCPPVVFKLLPTASEIAPEEVQKEPYIFLHSSEREQLKKYRLPKRRSEYITGRICAKTATSNHLQYTLCTPPPMNQIEINNSEYGHPIITFHPDVSLPVPEISISHSKEYGAAIAAQYRCGIDIQSQEKSLIKVREKYCTEQEEHILLKVIPKGNELLRLSLLWSAKEAIQKSFSTKTGMPTFLGIHLQAGQRKDDNNVLFSFSLPPEQNRRNQKNVTVAAGIFMNYAIAVFVLEENS